MELFVMILAGIYVALCVGLIIVVLFQNSKQQGLSGAISGTAETFFGKNKGRSLDAKLKKYTTIGAGVFIFLSILISFLIVKYLK